MERLGRYEVGRVLGEGGAGRVHEAVLCGPGGFRKSVALKILHSGAGELRREARIGGLLRHQNLVDVYEVGQEEGQWVCAIELGDGTLADHTPLPQRAIVEVAHRLAQALYNAHFGEGLDIAQPEQVGEIAQNLDIDPQDLLEAVQSPEVKARLKSETDAALEAGVFGSPFFIVDGEPFWGADRLGQLDRWLETGGF